MKHVYLFDIDGTLVSAQGMGGKAFRRAVSEILQYELAWQTRDFAGMTDAGLFRRALSEKGLPHDETTISALANLYHDYLGKNLAEKPALVLPGAEKLVRQFASQSGIHIGLLTGNTRRGSELKLAGLWQNFGFGFYGDDHAVRTDLGIYAREQISAKFGEHVEITIIGDTPNDIACARAAGARCVAVATGAYSADELSEADEVIADLTAWPAVFN
ncbi:HAD family hydrolase [Turneriella parva]|uniref:phosphoglycolate phosphatase n=1 Tax=Turneriella parva (strain ATCC BAA-1111 / DSM 21527 / NCTC 11395 / H) TaxID=869212 RepID=I4B7R3_TURPD|nr:HAD-IA family hydrolase [Turneriella parva]AFM13320.1 HAD-superfamily hydrolase, subfamily IA, variant 1 [Turneriella parva DSM 21527]